MDSPLKQIEELRAFARFHSSNIDDVIGAGRCIFDRDFMSSDEADMLALAAISEITCLQPLRSRQPSDPISHEMLSVWLTAVYAIALTRITWPDGVIFTFATSLVRNSDRSFDF